MADLNTRKEWARESLQSSEPHLQALQTMASQAPTMQPLLDEAQALRERILIELDSPQCDIKQVRELLGQFGFKIHQAIEVARSELIPPTTLH